jgi:hypothetical protein
VGGVSSAHNHGAPPCHGGDRQSSSRAAARPCRPEDHKFAEPVALSSAQPADRPLPRRASRLSLNLIALRARRSGQPMRSGRAGQVREAAYAFAASTDSEGHSDVEVDQHLKWLTRRNRVGAVLRDHLVLGAVSGDDDPLRVLGIDVGANRRSPGRGAQGMPENSAARTALPPRAVRVGGRARLAARGRGRGAGGRPEQLLAGARSSSSTARTAARSASSSASRGASPRRPRHRALGSSLVDSTLSIGAGPAVAPADVTTRLVVGSLYTLGVVGAMLAWRRRHDR